MMDEKVEHDEDQGRFYITTDGKEAYLAYSEQDGVLDLYSTYVPQELRGQGIAGKVVKEGLEHAKKEGYQVRPSCPYVAAYIQKHPEYQDLQVRSSSGS